MDAALWTLDLLHEIGLHVGLGFDYQQRKNVNDK